MFTPCLGIIFQRVTDKKVTGHKLFQSFVQENKACFWNMNLVEAINSTKYVGYIKPSTLFITSMNERYMQTLRDAWIRRILKPAKGYRIETFGDVENIGMHKIDQMHLVPLLDIICNVVFKLNQSGRPAVLDDLLDEIRKEYPKIEPPSAKTFRQAIHTLLKQNILEYDLEQLYICFPPTAPYHSTKTFKCTVECQTGQSVMNGYAPSNSLKIKKGILAKLFMKKDTLPKAVQLRQNLRSPSDQRQYLEIPTASTQANNSCETSCAAQKTCLFHENELYRKWIKTKDQYLLNNFSPVSGSEYIPFLTNCKNINNKIRRKKRSRKKNERSRTSTRIQWSSDSAFSLSPVITKISKDFYNSHSGDISPDEPTVMNRNHTYVNVLSSESTQFEDITQAEKILLTTFSIANV
ncbi:Winged helix Storkhead-box1 domain family protein [Brugia pahangi]